MTDPKPSTGACEHDRGDSWGPKQFAPGIIYPKSGFPICPHCNGASLGEKPNLMAPNTAEIRKEGKAAEIVMKVLRWEPISQYQFLTAKEQQKYSEDINHLALSVIEIIEGLEADHLVAMNAKDADIKRLKIEIASYDINYDSKRAEVESLESQLHDRDAELARIRSVAEKLRDSDDENEISMDMNTAGEYMLKVLDGENFS